MNIFQKILNYKKLTSTYAVGLIQAKAYRVLKHKTNVFLLPYHLTTVEWALLGILYESNDGETLTDLAFALGVKGPFVTRLATALTKKEYVAVTKSATDSRVRRMTLTTKGKKHVEHIEKLLKLESKEWIKDVSTRDLISYLRVLNAIIRSE